MELRIRAITIFMVGYAVQLVELQSILIAL